MNDLSNAVAVIGMAARVPGARNVTELWANLASGRACTSRFDRDQLAAAGVDPAEYDDPRYVPVRGVLEDVEKFDAGFFGFTPREAEITDPQHRVMLECTWEALEAAGYPPHGFDGLIGVFAGSSMNTYLLHNVLANPDLMARIGSMPIVLANEKDHLATRIAYKLDLRGPALTVQTACSTSLVAVHMAVQSLLTGEVDLALAGGASISVPQHCGHIHTPNGIGSADGRVCAFDAEATGTIAGNGAGVVALKRAEEALADGDIVHALILGSAVNNDGAAKVGYTAPSVQGQAQVIGMAHQVAGVGPETITYVEAHGTGTELGDPIEVAALTEAFRVGTDRTGFCALGTLKPNVGHLDAAAGIAGLIKCVLALRHEAIPPTINFGRPNPHIPFADGPFFVNTRLLPWPSGAEPRRCGVSSFGIGGTNAHVVLEEAPPAPARHRDRTLPALVTLSARTPAGLGAAAERLARHLADHPESDVEDVAHTLQVGRTHFAHRRVVVAGTCTELREHLTARADATEAGPVRDVVFVFPGQGAQYAGMAAGLYREFENFRATVDTCAELLRPELHHDLRGLLCPALGDEAAADELLARTELTQPALFVVEYALADLLRSWGIRPTAMLGHSIGEYTAACLAGAFPLADGLRLVAARGQLMAAAPKGAMLAVAASEDEVVEHLTSAPGMTIAAVNSPRLVVVAGPPEAIAQAERRLSAAGIHTKPLRVSHAFHSPLMEPVLGGLRQRAGSVEHRPLAVPVYSNVTGEPIPLGTVLSADYWCSHLRQPVRFRAAAEQLVASPDAFLLEVGPGRSLTSLIHQTASGRPVRIVPTLPGRRTDDYAADADVRTLLAAVGAFWASGGAPDFRALVAGTHPQRIELPTYPFQRQRYWVDPPPRRGTGDDREVGAAHARTGCGDAPLPPDPTEDAGGDRLVERPVAHDSLLDEIEQEVIRIWRELLGIESIRPEHSFFDLGGHSLLVVQMTARLRESLGVEVTVRQVFESPTARGVAERGRALMLAEALTEELDAEVD